MKRTAIYMRVSTSRQAEEGDSIPAQRAALRKYIDEHEDLVFAGEYLDDGISGTKEDRQEFQRMLSDAKDGKIDLLIFTKLDRIHRSLRNFLNMQDVFEKHNVHWLAIWEPMYDSSTPQGRMIINTMMNLAQFEAENTGQRIRQVFEYKRQNGEVTSGVVPVGYSIVDKHLVPNEDADKVRSVFEYFARTGKLYETYRYCNSIFDRTRSGAVIKKMLRNEKYIGRSRGVENYCPAIISAELFEDVQSKLQRNIKASQKYAYIFSGLLVCGECGHRMSSGIHSNTNRIYRCKHHYCSDGTEKCSNTKIIREDKLEEYLLQNIKITIQDRITQIEEAQKKPNENKKRLAQLHKKLGKLKDLYLNDLITLEEYKNDKSKFQEEIETLQAQPQPQDTDISALQAFLAMDLEEVYKFTTNEEKRLFWRSILKEIRFYKDRRIEPVPLL